ncbi:cysteine hydrolase family protein [Pigmentiphaga aceris]|uniref:cysteine hydrolase family protein n=1 Tax=Pigmentiphaga aceris TaxID=1940612 RepID=UPI003CCC618D
MTDSIHLVLIDPQNDFCDLPAGWCGSDPLSESAGGLTAGLTTGPQTAAFIGSLVDPLADPAGPTAAKLHAPALPVPGAHQDMLRIARLIDEASERISAITVTLDSHHRLDIAHPGFWTTRDDLPVAAFTQITAAQLRAGDYRPRDATALARAQRYLDELEQRGRYTLMVWPVHCEIGSWGHNVHPAVKAAYNRWEDQHLRVVGKLSKGSNPWTEHYSAVRAEVPDANDPATQLNAAWLAELDRADQIVIAGEAGSHCVRATVEDIADHLPSQRLDKLVLLTDCMSPVGGFDAQQQTFLDNMRKRGLRLCSSADFLSAVAARRA